MSRFISLAIAGVILVALTTWFLTSNAPNPQPVETSGGMTDDDAASTAGPVAEEPDLPPETLAALADVREILEEYVLNDAVEPEAQTTNNEASPGADAIGAREATDPAFISDALRPESFNAERAVALIQAAPRLTAGQKAELQTAVQATIDYPEAQAKMLSRLEVILLSLI